MPYNSDRQVDKTLNHNTKTKLQNGLTKAITYFILLSCFVILGLYAIQRFGAQYAEQKIQEQLAHSGLTEFVRYENVYFNAFTLTPSIENISFGSKNAPWLTFARISFNSYLLKHPNLDVDFWIQQSPIDSLSTDTRRLMRAAGIDTLLGKGSFSSQEEGEDRLSQLTLDIKDVGKITFNSKITLRNKNIDLSELRTDLLASFALGQPEAMLLIYGEEIDVQSLALQYEESGLVNHLFPASDRKQEHQTDLQDTLTLASQVFGLAPADSPEAKHIAITLEAFLNAPQQLTLSISPSSAISLKELTLLANEGSLYKNSQMAIKNN